VSQYWLDGGRVQNSDMSNYYGGGCAALR
jgi:hypothetical protein